MYKKFGVFFLNSYTKMKKNKQNILSSALLLSMIPLVIIMTLIIFKKNEINEMNIVIPTLLSDFKKMKNIYKFYQIFIIGINNLVFIGNEELENFLKNYNFKIPIKFINEKNLIDIDKIKKIIENKNKDAIKRSGWYIQ